MLLQDLPNSRTAAAGVDIEARHRTAEEAEETTGVVVRCPGDNAMRLVVTNGTEAEELLDGKTLAATALPTTKTG
jgi:hypothetical protein